MTSSQDLPATDLDPAFVFDFRSYDEPDAENQRWTTWYDVEPLCRGPEPRPDWVITDRAAVDTELGVLKTGKEADVFLLERAVEDGPSVVMAAKRYRDSEHRNFHRNAVYTEGRRGRDSREARAIAKSSDVRPHRRRRTVGQRRVGVAQALLAGRPAGPLPGADRRHRAPDGVDPVRRRDRSTAGADQARARSCCGGTSSSCARHSPLMAQHGIVHGDLSAYNLLAAGDRLVIIDLPQVLDLVGNPQGMDFLLRDCANVCGWFRARGLDPSVADEHALFSDVLATAF